jgi:hypothetical protein
VLVADCAAATLGDADETAAGDAGPVEAGAEADPPDDVLADAAALLAGLEATAGLPDDWHAVSSNAAVASRVPAAALRALRLFKVSMNDNSSTPLAAQRARSPLRRLWRPAGWDQLCEGEKPRPFGINIMAGTGR